MMLKNLIGLKTAPILILSILVLPIELVALGLGDLEVESSLNEPLKAKIELLSATAEDIGSLKISIAEQEEFDRIGIGRTDTLSRLRFTIGENDEGGDYVQISSRDVIVEPFLNFLLEVEWVNGHLFREYTILLDPPNYTAHVIKKRPVSKSQPVEQGQIERTQIIRQQTTAVPMRSDEIIPQNQFGGQYGPAVTGDTLWAIAKAAKAGSSVSMQQMMVAILNANPKAFINNNINGLKRGAVLHIPDLSAVNSIAQKDAFTHVKQQNFLWDEYKNTRVRPLPEQKTEPIDVTEPAEPAEPAEPEKAVEEATVVETVVKDTGPKLQIVSESDQDASGMQSTTESPGEANLDALNDQLALANESIDALSLENTEIQEKLYEGEEIINDLQRLIDLKENELAALQAQIAVAAKEAQEIPAEATDESERVKDETKDTVSAEPAPVDEAGSETSFSLGDVIDTLKSNIVIIAALFGGLILITLLILFFIKRHRDSGELLDINDLTEELIEEGSELSGTDDATLVRGEELSDDSDILLDDSDAFDIPDDSDKTKQISVPVVADVDDPMEEVNVFLAYEHFSEAESFVKDALEKDPDNLDFHIKLLEVFYASSHKKAYEDAARVIHEKTNGAGEYWDMVTVMWQEISPNRKLFEGPTEEESNEASEQEESAGIVNITDEISIAAGDLDSMVSEDKEDPGLDMTLGSTADLSATPPRSGVEDMESPHGLDQTQSMLDVESPEEGEELLDITSSVDLDKPLELGDENEGLDDGGGEGTLDVTGSIDLGESPTSADEAEESLDISLDDGSGDIGEGTLDIVMESNSADEAEESLDISLDDDVSGDIGDGTLDVVMESNSADEAEEFLDISLDDGDSDTELEGDSGDAGEGSLDMLDVTSPMSLEKDIVDVSDEELLDISSDDDSTLGISTESMEALEEEDIDEDKTFLVPKSSNIEEQSVDEEISSQLDLAKAYIGLGDTESAKIILDEITEQGNDNYRKQAEELLKQLG